MHATQRQGRGSRRLILLPGVVVLGVTFSGCAMFFPSRPNDLPLYFVVEDGHVQFRWCGDSTNDSSPKSATCADAQDGRIPSAIRPSSAGRQIRPPQSGGATRR